MPIFLRLSPSVGISLREMQRLLSRSERATFSFADLVAISPFTLLLLLTASSTAQELPLHGDTVLKFATVEEGRAALTKEDVYVRAQSRYDRQSRLGTDQDVTDEEYFRFVAAAVEPWSEPEVEALTATVESVRKRLAPYKLVLPPQVLLVRTSGKEEGNAAYCRGNAIVLPARLVPKSATRDLEKLFLHELFHVLSNQNPELRKTLYAIIGFKPSPGVAFPKSLRDRKITNPDAPTIDYHIEVTIDGQLKAAAPILYTSVEKYDPKAGGTFFQHMLFKLMLIEQIEGRWRAVEVDGKAVVFDPRKVPSFMDQIGGNTNYIIHPDEILADNFVHMALETENLATPRIIESMKKALRKE